MTLRGRPFSNLFCALASPAGSTMHSSTDASCMIDVQGESAMEIPGVLGLQIDPVVDTVARERTGLLFFVLDRSPVVTFDHNRARQFRSLTVEHPETLLRDNVRIPNDGRFRQDIADSSRVELDQGRSPHPGGHWREPCQDRRSSRWTRESPCSPHPANRTASSAEVDRHTRRTDKPRLPAAG